ncbi:MAG: hypothetical protein JSV20_08960 [Candidatus Bathyarchaeota archaeon]|nr:MAG: hypothetical protein JSV20_08960 [Candidatus Bathyarchaeota archaeon]
MASKWRGVFKHVSLASLSNRIRQQVSKKSIALFFCLLLILFLSISIRLLPIKWGFTISEFDPYFNYDVTKYVVENGFSSWSEWYTYRAWYPFGRDIEYTSFPGIPFTGAFLYHFISALGFSVTVMDVCIIFPVLMAALTCIVAYYFGKELGGIEVGLLSSLFLAINPAYIGRTNLGFYDTETVGIFATLLAFLLYLRSLKQENKWYVSLFYAIMSGLSLGYVFSSWGASRYPFALLTLFTLILLIIKQYSRRLLISYSTLMGVGILIAVNIPKLGFHFLKELEGIAVFGMFSLLLMYEVAQRFESYKTKVIFITSFISLLGLLAVILWHFGFISLPLGKFMSVINPFERTTIPIVESVQEHRPATWSSFYYQFGILVFLAPLAMIFIFRKLTNEKIFLITYFLSTLYFAASMIRLTVIMAPAICALSALAIVELLKPFISSVIQKPEKKRRIRRSKRMGKGFSLLPIVCLFLLILWPLVEGLDSAYAPTTIASSSIPIRDQIDDWSEALIWMQNNTNLPEDTVVASWWDYGYWITVIAEKTTLADNGTINATQIAQIGRMFMSNETEALTILKRYNVTHVVVFTTIGLARSGQLLYGDEVKWRWMAKIAGLNDTKLEDTSITSYIAQVWSQTTQDPNLLAWYQQFSGFALPKSYTVLTKLMINGAFGQGLLPLTHFQLVFSSSGWNGQFPPMVFIYEVLY